MEKLIFEGFGIQIIEKLGQKYIRYDGGQIAIKMMEIPVSDEDSLKAMRSEQDAYEVILKAQNK